MLSLVIYQPRNRKVHDMAGLGLFARISQRRPLFSDSKSSSFQTLHSATDTLKSLFYFESLSYAESLKANPKLPNKLQMTGVKTAVHIDANTWTVFSG